MNGTEAAEDVVWKNTLVTVIIYLVGTLGIIWNALAIVVVSKNPILKNSFGLLCISHSMANLGVLVIFVVWCGVTTALQQHHLSDSFLGKRLGQINIFFWDSCVYSHLAISINRLVTMSFPQQASKLLSIRNTLLMLAVVYLLGAAHASPYWWDEECYFTYSAFTWTWDFSVTDCGKIISIYFDYYTGVGVCCIMMVMDLTTFFQLRKMNQAVGKGQTGAFKNNRRKVEQRFFLQAVVQGSIFFYELLNFYWVYTLNSDPLFIYFTTTFAWELCHALDGLVVVSFHFRGAFKCLRNHGTLITVTSRNSMSQREI